MSEYTPLSADFLGFHTYLSDPEREALAEIRAYLEADLAPHVNGLWERAEFPHQIVAPLAELGAYSFGYEETRPFENSAVFRGLMALELARVDASVSTFAGVHGALAMGSVALCGSDEQRAHWLPKMADGEVIGCFALTEPDHGSDVAGGLETTARREGDEWVLNGSKRWIGNGTWADIAIVWAKNEEDGKVLGFVVPTSTPGYTATKIEGKYSLRIVQNADITFEDLRVPESLRLQGANGFKDTAKVLRLTRLEVGFSAIGNAIGAYEKGAGVHEEPQTVRQADRRVPIGPGPAGEVAEQYHLSAIAGRLCGSDEGRGAAERRTFLDGQADGLQPMPRSRGLVPRGPRRQRHRNRLRRHPALQRRRSPVLLRGHTGGQHANRRPGDHRRPGLRIA